MTIQLDICNHCLCH